ncbi:hypothetical protein A0H81_00192 [Grifola frondosa]|uniref:Histone deacetylase complex subunit SAP30 Sin3 binding domain-containing protein n=1 Tax=Grifola frondosa TaxID=5627 RepID=A0A1C7MRH5_GRIFR|nr:hypothetical protein A0H81_00192 [Grifola frondosa]
MTGANNASVGAGPSSTTSRSRAQASRKRTHAPADDAAYHAGAGTKRAAGDRAEGERERAKRKRIEVSAGAGAGGADKRGDGDGRISLVDFTAMPTEALHRYLTYYDLIPELDPDPLSAENPVPPSSLFRPGGSMDTGVGPRLRRSSRLVEDEWTAPPVLADVGDVHGVLAAIAQKHFRETTAKEVDTLASFMCAVKAKARMQM